MWIVKKLNVSVEKNDWNPAQEPGIKNYQHLRGKFFMALYLGQTPGFRILLSPFFFQ